MYRLLWLVVVILVACGDGGPGGAAPDGSIVPLDAQADGGVGMDAGMDAAMDAPVPGIVDVQVLGEVPEPGVRVVFAAADNTLIADVTTDAQGKVTATMENGHVTVLLPLNGGGGNVSMVTLLGVKAGDSLKFAGPNRGLQSIGTATVVPPTADTGFLFRPCTSGNITGPASITIFDAASCRTNVGLLARQFGAEGVEGQYSRCRACRWRSTP